MPSSGHGKLRRWPVAKSLLTVTVIMLALLSLLPAASADQPVTYVIDNEDILGDFSMSQFCTFVRVGDTAQVIMDDPVIIIGSGVDDYERKGIEKTLSYNYFRSQYILDDTATEFMGRNLTEYNLILIGGPEHNAYTKYLLDSGYLTYATTDEKMPAVILEVASLTPGNKVLVIGDSSGYPYSKNLPLSSIIPDEYAPAAAVVTGFGLGFISLFLGKIFSWVGSYIQQSVQILTNTVSDYASSHTAAALSEVETKLRKVQIDEGKVKQHSRDIFLGLTSFEIGAAIVASLLFAIAFIIADQMDFSLEIIAMYFVIAGIATVAHEIGHRIVAHKYKIKTEFKFWGMGTAIMLFTSWLFGTVFSEPARTLVDAGEAKETDIALMLLTGPAVSVLFALLFLPLVLLGGIFVTVGTIGFSMNLLNGLYELMPFKPMDGKDVYKWNKVWWCVAFFPLLFFYLTVTIMFL
jgi:Zn-dependent protease